MAGFERALEAGVQNFELDVHTTRDGIVVVTHDPQPNRDITRDVISGQFLEIDGPLIKDLTYADLRAYDVGRINPATFYELHFPKQQVIDGETIPQLIDVLRLLDRYGAAVTIEVKSVEDKPELTIPPGPFVELLQKVIDQTPPWQDITISSFDWRVLGLVHKLMPGVPTAALTDDEVDASIVDDIVKLGSKIWSPFFRDIDTMLVQSAQSVGIQVIPWTVNDPADKQRVTNMGVDGIITDYPY